MERRRCYHDIIADILRMDGCTKTQIMYSVQLSYKLTADYLKQLDYKNLMRLMPGGSHGARGVYRTTVFGNELLKAIDRVNVILE